MRADVRRIALATIIVATCSGAAAEPPSIASLSWLSGCWASERGEPGSGEMWSAPAGGTMLGISRTIKDGKTVEHEFMQIREEAPGRIVFIALPSGQVETRFTLVRSEPHEWVFENPDHDFPQRVVYRLNAPDELHAYVEGTRGGATKRFDFRYKRASCPARAQ
ncbi:MAG TPA: DUF6265 family protein [Steroidobacter sp.]